MRRRAITVGDKFSDGKHVWEVIARYPGGKLDLFDRGVKIVASMDDEKQRLVGLKFARQ